MKILKLFVSGFFQFDYFLYIYTIFKTKTMNQEKTVVEVKTTSSKHNLQFAIDEARRKLDERQKTLDERIAITMGNCSIIEVNTTTIQPLIINWLRCYASDIAPVSKEIDQTYEIKQILQLRNRFEFNTTNSFDNVIEKNCFDVIHANSKRQLLEAILNTVQKDKHWTMYAFWVAACKSKIVHSEMSFSEFKSVLLTTKSLELDQVDDLVDLFCKSQGYIYHNANLLTTSNIFNDAYVHIVVKCTECEFVKTRTY